MAKTDYNRFSVVSWVSLAFHEIACDRSRDVIDR